MKTLPFIGRNISRVILTALFITVIALPFTSEANTHIYDGGMSEKGLYFQDLAGIAFAAEINEEKDRNLDSLLSQCPTAGFSTSGALFSYECQRWVSEEMYSTRPVRSYINVNGSW